MKRKREIDKKGLIMGFVAAVAVVALAVGVVVSSQNEPVPEGYFTDDGSKLVKTLDAEMSGFEVGEWAPIYTYVVYYYNGDAITNARIYFEYANEASAKSANENIDVSEKSWATGKSLNGKYIVWQVKKSEYEGLTKAEVEEDIENARAAGAAL